MEETVTAAGAISGLNTVWVLMAAFLVFFMQAGFALLEAGFTQAKNAVNIIMKNVLDVCFGTLVFFMIGFGLMFTEGNGFIGQGGFMMRGLDPAWSGLPTWAFFLFQVVFAATAATIVSGAMAERTRFSGYILFSILLSALVYPIVGHWVWGGGWLAQRGFLDFAGSTVVHSVGGWAALAGILVVGPRLGRFGKDYDKKRFSGHSIPLAALGVFILWFGWFGFNPGSQLAAEGADNANAIALIALNTQLAACAGAVGALLAGWLRTRMAKAGFVLNGTLGGLVAVTAPCAFVTPAVAIVIGLIGGLVVVEVANGMEKAKIDDAVGAVPVHLGAGVWGTLALGLFSTEGGVFYGGGWTFFGAQLTGVLAVGAFTFVSCFILFHLINMVLGIRAGEKEEKEGLDLKHGQAAYPDFSHS